jgi:MYXO-CTERM domain-containing protein
MRLVTAFLLVTTATAQAHVTLMYPPPRTADQKEGPCGKTGSTRGTNVTTFQPGETIMVRWDETVDHPGHYRIAFDDAGDDVFRNPNNPNDAFPSTMVEPIADKAGGLYMQAVTLPMEPCASCTLQLMQVMTTSVPYNSFYYQCADITIAGDPVAPPGDDIDGGCSTGAGAGPGLLVLGALAIRRRRRR